MGIGFNVFALAVFKYWNFFIPELLQLFQGLSGETLEWTILILVHIGLSYRVLENISYLVDVYRGQIPASKNFFDFALYSMYFLKMLSGPIERARSFLPKLAKQRYVDNDVLIRNVTLILIGAFRKLVIADTISGLINPIIFERPWKFSSAELIIGVVAYLFIVYNNFAGYTNIMRGMSGLFGIELSRNFSNPLFSRNFSELWSRWHITLSMWLRDYIYMPLSRVFLRHNPNLRNVPYVLFPPLLTMLVSALWHGAYYHIFAWGGLMGVYLIIGRIRTLWKPAIPPDKRPWWRQLFSVLVVFGLHCFSLIFFCVEIDVLEKFFKVLLARSTHISFGLDIYLLFGLSLLIDWFQYHGRDELVFLRWPRWVRAILLSYAILALFLATRMHVAEPFIYQGF